MKPHMDREVVHEGFSFDLECRVNFKLWYLLDQNELGFPLPIQLKLSDSSFSATKFVPNSDLELKNYAQNSEAMSGRKFLTTRLTGLGDDDGPWRRPSCRFGS